MDFAQEVERRVAYIKERLRVSGAKGIVVGNSGGKDSALVLILSKKACDNTLAVIMPCQSARNYGIDKDDGMELSKKFGIETVTVDLTATRTALLSAIGEGIGDVVPMTQANVAPRLRMATLYAIAQTRGALVAGTGNACEAYMGYFTKWGDGAHDFNPVADLTVSQIYGMLRYLGAPESIITKAPSAGLFEGQTDEKEMGVTYAQIEDYLEGKAVAEDAKAIIERYHAVSEHKRQPISVFTGGKEEK